MALTASWMAACTAAMARESRILPGLISTAAVATLFQAVTALPCPALVRGAHSNTAIRTPTTIARRRSVRMDPPIRCKPVCGIPRQDRGPQQGRRLEAIEIRCGIDGKCRVGRAGSNDKSRRPGTILQADASPPDTQTAEMLRFSSEKSRWPPVAARLRQQSYFHRLISGDTHEARFPRHGPGSRGHCYGEIGRAACR